MFELCSNRNVLPRFLNTVAVFDTCSECKFVSKDQVALTTDAASNVTHRKGASKRSDTDACPCHVPKNDIIAIERSRQIFLVGDRRPRELQINSN